MAVAALAWIACVALLIQRQPPSGSPSIDALTSDVQSAVSLGDADSLSRLFLEGSVNDGYAAAYLRKVESHHPTVISVTATELADGVLLAVSGVSSDGIRLCTEWNVRIESGRYLLDGVAPAVSTGCE